MSNKRTVLSRPRTRLYDANYNIGESYYRPALDRLDRKYSGRPLSPVRQTTPLNDIADRHARAFADEDLDVSRRRAEKRIKEEHVFDSRGTRLNRASLLADNFDSEFNEEPSAAARLRSRKKPPVEDVDMESTSSNIKSYRLLDRSEKILDTVGINESLSQNMAAKEASQRRRALKVTFDPEGDDLTRWTPMENGNAATSVRAARREETISVRAARSSDDSTSVSSAAAIRARQSKERINDIEEEMAAMAEKQAAREARVARLRALVAETEQDSADFEVQQTRIERASARKERSVHF